MFHLLIVKYYFIHCTVRENVIFTCCQGVQFQFFPTVFFGLVGDGYKSQESSHQSGDDFIPLFSYNL